MPDRMLLRAREFDGDSGYRPTFGAASETGVFGPAWSLDGTRLYFTKVSRKFVEYRGNGQFGPEMESDVPADQFVFAGPDDVFSTSSVVLEDYDLARHRRVGGTWEVQTLPPAYFRLLNDGWPEFDRVRQDLYWERVDNGAFIARAHLDASGALPETFETLDFLGDDLGDPDISPDGRRMYVSSRRSGGTDNDIYMSERPCE